MLLSKEKTYSVSEFVEFLNTKDMKKVDREVGIMLKKSTHKKILVTVTACLLHCTKAFADISQATAKMNEVGSTIFGLCQTASYWLCLISCGLEIAKCISTGDSKSVSKVIPKYIIGFAGIYFLPWIFDLIKSIF